MENNKSYILVADDEEISRNMIIELLHEMGLESKSAAGGEQVLELLKEFSFDLILLDIKMPEPDGYKILEILKNDNKLRLIPVIMITMVDETKSVVDCITRGAEDYLTKPFEPAILKARIKNSLEKYRSLKQEKVLLEKTLTGSIKILTECLSMLRPAVFGQSTQVSRICRNLANWMGLKETWHVEIAALFSQLGSIILSSQLLDRISKNAVLSAQEQKKYGNSVRFGYNLINQLPRLDKVAQIILHQHVHYSRLTSAPASREKQTVPMESFILSLATDFNLLTAMGLDTATAVKKLHTNKNKYHPQVLQALDDIIGHEENKEIKPLNIADIKPGMIFMQDVISENGTRIIAKGKEASDIVLMQLNNIAKQSNIKEPILLQL